MRRLIDADKLIEFANNHKNKMVDANDIARFPTAYSVDKVLEQLRKQDDVCTGCKHKECSWCSIGERIEIVKGGGVDAE